jgi:hypothetical protein
MMLAEGAMRRVSLLVASAVVLAALALRPASAQTFRATFLPPGAVGTETPHHVDRPRPMSMAVPLRTHRDPPAATVDCAMAVPANPNIDQRMTLLHPPPDLKFSMRLIVVPPCKR